MVLDEVGFDVRRGESIAIVGPSGMGKTTLLAILGGLIEPDSGRVGVQTRGRDGLQPPEPWVSWVLQTTNVLRDRSVLANVRLGCFADAATWRKADGRARAALERVALGARADEPLRLLSGGEAQRVVIARAMASRRPFLLADEPTGQLDSATSRLVMDALLAASQRRGLVLVTHDAELAQRCDRVLRLTDGRLSDVATVRR
ncbi:ABC transporter ATP-binding protein [Nocardioides sp.]|uniref:ABC transporter ATP-binding protein n=1 Tax=Nocardioides sp. TaxID=35761 RepID=UPI003D0F23F3